MKELTRYQIKLGLSGKVRLFFHILNHPWETMQAINEFREENYNLKHGSEIK